MTVPVSNLLDPVVFLPDDDQNQLIYKLKDTFYNQALAVNSREISYYPITEIMCGNLYFSESNTKKFRSVFRKLFNVGTIASGATSTIAHGITGIVHVTNIYGGFKTAVPDWRSFPYTSATTITDQVSVNVTATNLVIVNGATAPNITSFYLVLEYLKE